MRRSNFIAAITAFAVLFLCSTVASAQTGQLRGSVKLTGADGNAAPVAGAVIDVYRTDISGDFHTKSDKKGEWVFAGLPYVGNYVVAVSAPGAAPYAQGGVKAGREIPIDIVLQAGDGKKLTQAEALAAAKGGGGVAGPSSSGGRVSEADKAKAAEIAKKNAEIEASNKKVESSNKIVADSFKAGNAALAAKNYDEAIKEYDTGLAADPAQPALLTNKAMALKARGVDRYNAAIKMKDDDANKAAKAAGIESAKADFKDAVDAANKAADFLKNVPAGTDPNEQKQQTMNKYAAMSARAEAYRLFVTKADASQADAGIAAFQDYIAVETDPAKKAADQLSLAQMLFEAGAADKAVVEFKKILDVDPDNVDALYGMGVEHINIGYAVNDKSKLQEGVNYLQRFVDKAPDTHKYKAEAKATIAEMKNTESVVPEKTPPRRRRP